MTELTLHDGRDKTDDSISLASIICYQYGKKVKLDLYLTPYKNQFQMFQELKCKRTNLKLLDIVQKYIYKFGVSKDLLNKIFKSLNYKRLINLTALKFKITGQKQKDTVK